METEKSEAISLQDKCEETKALETLHSLSESNAAKDSSWLLLIPHESGAQVPGNKFNL